MVHLDSITTKTGDAGKTRLGDGTEVSKTSVRIEAIGTIDELNCVLGVCCAHQLQEPYFAWLRKVQNALFDLGAEISVPEKEENNIGRPSRITAAYVQQLDVWLKKLHRQLPALSSFILPGGSVCSAHLHIARAICRRAERDVLKLAAVEKVSDQVTIYLNRLSDLLFQLARITEDPQNPAPLWVPG